MGVSPQPLKSLLHQAVSLVEEFHRVSHGLRPVHASRRAAPLPEQPAKPVWLKPNANCDLAGRVALGLARKTGARVGYLAVGECAVHAVARLWFQFANVDAGKVPVGELEETDFPRITRAAGRIATATITFTDRDVPARRIRQTTRQFIEECRLEYLVVDDPDVATLRNPKLSRDMDRWRVRMEFREAVRGTEVTMILPGEAPGFHAPSPFD